MILGVTGFKGSGKDTFAQPFIEAGFLHLRFADPLKAMLRALLVDLGEEEPYISAMIDGHLKEEPYPLFADKTPRFLMQTLGTEWRNMIHKELWTRIAHHKLHYMGVSSDFGQSVIITDVRFPHEAQMIKDVEGKLIRISRATCCTTGHESEIHIESLPSDIVVHNNHGIEWLHSEARRILAFLASSEAR